ncbi:hypothetical protein BGX31_001419 [Mortierella sp. GBA43]|nr:hypothetical protein BGX31_001419 [Mortierella sp. GBA43]
MTQAELAQFGRLRAEMPRAPGPSTGAQPRRIGFGSDANTGLAARPKVPSKLGMYMATATSGHFSSGPDTMQLQRQQQQYQQLQQRRKHNALLTTITTTYPEPIVPTESLDEGLALKRLSMVVAAMVSALPWTGALGTRPYARSDACSSVYSGKQLEEMELGERTRPGRSKSCTERRHSRQGSGDEDDVETESEDHLHDSLGEEDEGDNEQEDEEEDEEDREELLDSAARDKQWES